MQNIDRIEMTGGKFNMQVMQGFTWFLNMDQEFGSEVLTAKTKRTLFP